MEMAESGTPVGPTAEIDVAAPPSPARDAGEEEQVPQGSGDHARSPAGSPQATGGGLPRVGLKLEAGSSPSQAPWTLARGGSSLSGARRSSAFRLACSALDGLETQLALEEAELGHVRAELERARVRLLETMERCRHGDETSWACCEEALNFAKEVRESAAREAEEVLAPVTAERRAAAENRAAAAADRAAMKAALATREAKII